MPDIPVRFWRYVLLTPVLGVIGVAVLWALGLASFIITIYAMTPDMTPRKTDGIVVLTGGSDRVRTGLALLLQDGQAEHILISGVNHSATLEDVLKSARIESIFKLQYSRIDRAPLLRCCVTLGFQALDTAGNAAETAAWVKKYNMHSITLVTSNYHMPRGLVEIKRVLPDVVVVPYPVKTQDSRLLSKESLKLGIFEYHKTVFALGRAGLSWGRQLMTQWARA